MIVGILALQGAFIEHKYILDKLQVNNILHRPERKMRQNE
jgi:glutamine amidotransferase PdxT